MRTKRRIAAFTFIATILFGPAVAIGGIEKTTLIAELLREVNIQREHNGKQPLRLNSRLTTQPKTHKKHVGKYPFGHLSPDEQRPGACH